MLDQNQKKFNPFSLFIGIFFLFIINPALGMIAIPLALFFFRKKFARSWADFAAQLQAEAKRQDDGDENDEDILAIEESSNQNFPAITKLLGPVKMPISSFGRIRLEKRKKYLHIALNSTLEEAEEIISQLPASDRILIEAGTPLIKIYGTEAVKQIKDLAPAGAYIVADNKCADLAGREVEMMAQAGASAATCLGIAPVEVINGFIDECAKAGLDSMIDMMNVDNPLAVLKKLPKLPTVVMLHRGVDESEFSKEKQIPYYQIRQIKGNYDVLVAVAGGDTIKEVQSALFNGADIVVVWKNFYQASADTAKLAESFLKEIK